MITYKDATKFPGRKIPVLHRVIYHIARHTVIDFFDSECDRKDTYIRQWCQDNCKHAYYMSPTYVRERFVQFECDEEALMFALIHGGITNV